MYFRLKMNSNYSLIIFSLFQANETKEKVDALKSDNKELEDKISALGQVVHHVNLGSNSDASISGDEVLKRRVHCPCWK